MFYVNNEQVKGVFLNGSNYNYLTYGFGKIIPEDRNAEQLNLNLAYKYLNQYRIEYGTVKDGYENALVSPRIDEPDSKGVFHTPFTYYYNGNIVPTKNIPVLITDGNYALRNALVYNDMNINGAINYFASNTDFQGHNVNVFPEKDNYQLLSYEMLNNCSNFDLNISTRFSKAAYPTLYNCNNFSGNFKYIGNSDVKYPGFRGFLYECKDGVFNIDCTNMHGGGSDANTTNFFNFIGIQRCENMNVNITGSPWQAWVHPNCKSSNCNITTRYIVPGFDHMNNCNFNIYLPSNANVEKSAYYSILSNSYNCNVNFNGTNASVTNLNNCKFEMYNCNTLEAYGVSNCNFNLYNSAGTAALRNLNGVYFVDRGGANYTITNLDNCYRSYIYANTVTGTMENVYNTKVELKNNNPYFSMRKVDKCEITGFPTSVAYTTNCTFNASIPVAFFRNSSYVTWANVWPHATPYAGYYHTNAGLRSVDNFSSCYLSCNNGSLVNSSSLSLSNSKEMIMNLLTFYNGNIEFNLPAYTSNIKINIDCRNLNLGVFQAGPPHGFQNATISANTIYAKGSIPSAYVQVNADTKIYCENYCNVCFRSSVSNYNSVLQPVVLINNYQHANSQACNFFGGLTRIGRLNFQGGRPADLTLTGGSCVFINNALLGSTIVRQNSLLFLGSNVRQVSGINVESGSLVVNRSNWIGSGGLSLIANKSFAWNVWDTGPWGNNQSLFDFCINV